MKGEIETPPVPRPFLAKAMAKRSDVLVGGSYYSYYSHHWLLHRQPNLLFPCAEG